MEKNPPVVDEEMGIKNITPAPGRVDVSAVTFDDALAVTAASSVNSKVHAVPSSTGTPNSSPTRKIKKEDVKDIFRASTNVGSVSPEQVARIKMMHDKISDGVSWDFNYGCLLTVASIVAGLGLVTDSATTVISSMLLSPIMGPVIGMSYGLIIWDLPLIKRSARNEVVSILACIIFGMIIGKRSRALAWSLVAYCTWRILIPRSPLLFPLAHLIQELQHSGVKCQRIGQQTK